MVMSMLSRVLQIVQRPRSMVVSAHVLDVHGLALGVGVYAPDVHAGREMHLPRLLVLLHKT